LIKNPLVLTRSLYFLNKEFFISLFLYWLLSFENLCIAFGVSYLPRSLPRFHLPHAPPKLSWFLMQKHTPFQEPRGNRQMDVLAVVPLPCGLLPFLP